MENAPKVTEVEDLDILGIIGFDGVIFSGLRIHPDGQHLVFPIGNKVTIQNWQTKKQYFLLGHTNLVCAIDVSRSGKYIGSGQINHIGFQAMVIVWSYETQAILSKHEIHKVRVESVVFSHDDNFLISLGGRDCGAVVVWDVFEGEALCGAQASGGTAGDANSLSAMNLRSECFLSGGDRTLRIWNIDAYARALSSVTVNMLKLRRVINCMTVDARDEIAYCGTSTGDILKIKLNFHHDAEITIPIKTPTMIGCFGKIPNDSTNGNKKAEFYENGVHVIYILPNGHLLIGAGDGIVDEVEIMPLQATHFKAAELKTPTKAALRSIRSVSVRSMVTSIQIINKNTLLVGTNECEVYSINIKDFNDIKLMVTCHVSAIYDLAFPVGYSEVFATASKDDVRIWSVASSQELLRIRVPNFHCSSVAFTYDGKSIVTGWNDGEIRAFTPLTGRLIYSILTAHNKGVSAIAVTRDGLRIISGGSEGQVRVWLVGKYKQKLLGVLKEHKGPVSALHTNNFDTECVSASTDGSCIIWDLERLYRKQILFRNTLFMCVRYYPTDIQILTGGSDRKIAYWEALDGSLIRELEGSKSSAINTLDISPDGSMFITGGNDQIVKLWKYQEGTTTHIGLGHAAVITAARFSPNGKYIVTTGASGSIFIWKCPYDVSLEKYTKSASPESAALKTTPKIETTDNQDEHISELESVRSTQSETKKMSDTCNICKANICLCKKRTTKNNPITSTNSVRSKCSGSIKSQNSNKGSCKSIKSNCKV